MSFEDLWQWTLTLYVVLNVLGSYGLWRRLRRLEQQVKESVELFEHSRTRDMLFKYRGTDQGTDGKIWWCKFCTGGPFTPREWETHVFEGCKGERVQRVVSRTLHNPEQSKTAKTARGEALTQRTPGVGVNARPAPASVVVGMRHDANDS